MQTREELTEKLIEHMSRVQRHMRPRPPSGWPGLDLTMRQTKTLFFLSDGPRRMSDVARRLRVETPSATSMIDRLAAKGLVERGHDPTDRRAVVCSLTQAGMDAIEEFWAQRTARTESLAAVLSTEELEVVVPALEIMADAAHRARSRRRKGHHKSTDREAQTIEAGV